MFPFSRPLLQPVLLFFHFDPYCTLLFTVQPYHAFLCTKLFHPCFIVSYSVLLCPGSKKASAIPTPTNHQTIHHICFCFVHKKACLDFYKRLLVGKQPFLLPSLFPPVPVRCASRSVLAGAPSHTDFIFCFSLTAYLVAPSYAFW